MTGVYIKTLEMISVIIGMMLLKKTVTIWNCITIQENNFFTENDRKKTDTGDRHHPVWNDLGWQGVRNLQGYDIHT